jgi:hypothetical protein
VNSAPHARIGDISERWPWLLSSVPEQSSSVQQWISSRGLAVTGTIDECRKMTRSGNGGLQQINGRTAFWNLPIHLSAQMPNGTTSLNGKVILAVGDFSQACSIGSRNEIKVMASTERFGDADQTAYIGVASKPMNGRATSRRQAQASGLVAGENGGFKPARISARAH